MSGHKIYYKLIQNKVSKTSWPNFAFSAVWQDVTIKENGWDYIKLLNLCTIVINLRSYKYKNLASVPVKLETVLFPQMASCRAVL